MIVEVLSGLIAGVHHYLATATDAAVSTSMGKMELQQEVVDVW